MKAAMGTVTTMEETKTELMALLRRISTALPDLRDGSTELRDAHANLQNIRRALARTPSPTPRP